MLALFSQKELSRLQGQSGFTSNGSICESPSAFKWDQAHGTFSPLMFDKRATQVFIYGFVNTIFFCGNYVFDHVITFSSCVVSRPKIMILHLSPLLGGSRKKKQN
jgi:hypothetical protein